MRTIRVKWLVSALAFLFLLFVCPRAWAAPAENPDFAYDIRSMIQANPDFSTYSDAGAPDGVIWLKRVHYGIAADGGVERQTMWILLGREGLPPKWLSWNVPVPKGGEAEILEASVYSPEDGEKIEAVAPADSLDGTLRSVTFSGLPEEFILVVHYIEVFPDKLSVDGLVWLSDTLPVWEAAVRVTVPSGHPFHHSSSPNIIPQEEEIDGRMVYEWHALNTAAEVHPSIRASGRDYVIFGPRNDRKSFARFIKDVEEAPLPPAPQAVADMLGGRRGARSIENFMTWLYEQPGIVLTSESREVPAEAPWTAREKVLLARKWLDDAGAYARLFWRFPFSPKDDNPICEAAVADPVLELSPPDSKTGASYCDMKHPPRIRGDEYPSSGIVYGLQETDNALEERNMAPQKAAENSLKVRFDLSLNDDGILAGAVQITARKAWRQFLFPNQPTDGDLAVLMSSMFTQVPRYSDLTFSESRTESTLTAALSGTQAIKGTEGSNIMVPPPPLIPESLIKLGSGPFPCSLNFPFAIDVRIVLRLPASTSNVLVPSSVPQGGGQIRYSESYKLDRRKRSFLAEINMTAGTTLIADDEAARFTEALRSWQAFIARYLPVQLNAR